MGLRGPQPKPTVLKLLQGNPGKRPLQNDSWMQPEVGLPDAPAHLNREARKEWKRITPILLELGVLTKLDRSALAIYCQVWGRLVDLETALAARQALMKASGRDESEAYMDRTPNGYRKQAVEIEMINALQKQVIQYQAQFGLSPSARVRIRPIASAQGELPGLERPDSWDQF